MKSSRFELLVNVWNCYNNGFYHKNIAGVDENGQLIGRFCGNPKTNPRKWLSLINKKPVIVIPTANAWIIFISDKSGSDKGFQLKYNFTGKTSVRKIFKHVSLVKFLKRHE